nr:hypothetical protein [Acholeplasmatales bacterium]
TYDFTATGQSDGIYYLGLNQQLYDLDSCMKYLKSNDYYGYQNIYLYGHSMGGYAVGAYDNPIIKAKVSISGYDNHIKELVSYMCKNKNKLIKCYYLIMFKIIYFLRKGFKSNVVVSKVLKNTQTKTLIIHGTNDEIVPFLDQSIYSKKNKINNDKIEYIKMEEKLHSSHNTVLASTECVLYQKEIMALINQKIKEGKTLDEAKDIILKDADVFKLNSSNNELIDIVDKFFMSN